eukprot:g5609.t1
MNTASSRDNTFRVEGVGFAGTNKNHRFNPDCPLCKERCESEPRGCGNCCIGIKHDTHKFKFTATAKLPPGATFADYQPPADGGFVFLPGGQSLSDKLPRPLREYARPGFTTCPHCRTKKNGVNEGCGQCFIGDWHSRQTYKYQALVPLPEGKSLHEVEFLARTQPDYRQKVSKHFYKEKETLMRALMAARPTRAKLSDDTRSGTLF